ncbi:MAG: diacylglycerol kinase [Pseudomonadota bacterium]
MPKPGATGLRRIINAAGYSNLGLRAAWQHESAFRQECVLFVVLLPVAGWLAETPLHFALLVAAALQVLIVELLNSAIEAVVDRVGHEHHTLAGRAKDMASASVALSIALLALVWGAYGWQRFT